MELKLGKMPETELILNLREVSDVAHQNFRRTARDDQECPLELASLKFDFIAQLIFETLKPAAMLTLGFPTIGVYRVFSLIFMVLLNRG
jgi:non-ribosomal peptide synthetase component F